MISSFIAYTLFVLGGLTLSYVTAEIISDILTDIFNISDGTDGMTIFTLSTLFYVVVIFLIFHFGV